ncbi:plasmid replication initiator TrfA [Pseudomonas syringae]|uniref:plasmid replication initiator TrfA n=1 Tax=Pseudomonas syringae TaxID=317 RepID=UPI0002098DEE|nr:plasmid replication initiator TrfA [Pseudomonas syringae]MDP5168581.1 plasmid replication initiator TrfA [Pseudomonas syringae pv. aptata str. DSM 50252]
MASLKDAAQNHIDALMRSGLSREDAAMQAAKAVLASSTSFPGVQSEEFIAAALVESSLIDFDAPTPEKDAVVSETAPKKKRSVVERLDEAVLARKQPELFPEAPGKTKPSPLDTIAAKVTERKEADRLDRLITEMVQLQLTLNDIAPWGNDLRVIPNDWARSAVFTVRNKNVKRRAYDNELVYHYNKEVEIHYTGIELRADDDELVWQQILEYSKHYAIGAHVYFTIYQLLADLGWAKNGFYYKRAVACLNRLSATTFQISSPRHSRIKALSLIKEFEIVPTGKRGSLCQVELSSHLVVLFANDHYSKVVWVKYRALSPTARRLFDYLVTHKAPYPLKLETFRLICGSESTRSKKWAEQTREACLELEQSHLVERAYVEKDVVYCVR